MRTRFKKVWCGSCASMQFAGECSHGRVVDGRQPYPPELALFPFRLAPLNPMMTGADVCGLQMRYLAVRSPLILPDPAVWTEYKLSGSVDQAGGNDDEAFSLRADG